MMVSNNLPIPSPLRPVVGTMGMPSRVLSWAMSSLSPLRCSSSYIFSAITIVMSMSISCEVR